VRDNFHHAQVSIFILYLVLEGIYLIYTNRKLWGSLLLAFGIDMKILPVVVIPYLIYRREWKPALYTIVFVLLFVYMPGFIIGFDYNKFLLSERWHLINPANHEHVIDTSERSFYSLSTLLATLLVKNSAGDHDLLLRRNIADISIEQLNIVINIARLVLILFTFYFLRTLPFRKVSSSVQRLYEISYLCMIVPLIFPHQQFYAFYFLFPAFTYLAFYIVKLYFNENRNHNEESSSSKKIMLLIFVGIAFFLTSSHLLLGAFDKYYDHYKTLTYGALLLIGILAFCKPDNRLETDIA